MKKTAKIVSLLLVFSLLLAVITGCSGSQSAGGSVESAEKVKVDPNGTHSITDQAGNQVELPNTIERVVITSLWPLPSVYVLFQGSAAKLVGIHPASQSAAKYSLLPRVAPEIANVESGFMKGNEVNVEELLKLDPDVVFYSASNTAEKEIYNKAGIPAVGFSTSIKQFNTIETINSWVELLGEIFNDKDKASGITEYGRQVEAQIQERLKGIKEEDKPRVLILYKYSDTQFQTSGSNFFGQYWCDATGAVNVASGLKGMADINMEQVYAWNPDIIYITNFSSYMPEDLYNNRALAGHDWSGVKAVQEHKVYKYPLGMYRWYPPSSDSPLSLWFQAQKNHPKLFGDIDLPQIVKDYYKKFYHVDLTDQEVEGIFNPAREAAEGV
ncbi:MAG TPA: ABC transporter substrate-binding protein [Desulfitobacteriaceae bacterium]|nr:ABC transporter substrate-binding protein [Desulfitobacteriaceae bacterium]